MFGARSDKSLDTWLGSCFARAVSSLRQCRSPLVALLAAAAITGCTEEASSTHATSMKTVYLQAGAGASPSYYIIKLQSNYLGRGTKLGEIDRPPGSPLLTLWSVYPSMDGMNERNKAALLNEATPNAAVHIALTTALDPNSDWGTEARDAAESQMREIGDHRLQGITKYEFLDRPGANAFYIPGDSGAAFVNCSFGRICKAVRSWNGVFAIRYDFDSTQIADLQHLDKRVIDLLSSFDFKPAS